MTSDLLQLLLPDGILVFFDITDFSNKDNTITIYLTEKNNPPTEYSQHKLSSKGFFDEITVRDFPLRGRACFLKIKRRKWLDEESGKVVSRNWTMVAEGTRMTQDLASFLKERLGYHADKL